MQSAEDSSQRPFLRLLLPLSSQSEREEAFACCCFCCCISPLRGEAEVPSAVDGVVEGGALGEGDRQS